jgi:hypothetical protein
MMREESMLLPSVAGKGRRSRTAMEVEEKEGRRERERAVVTVAC